ncbi:hypothetical protein EV182_004368, partial [Spiromyces aspiralis]
MTQGLESTVPRTVIEQYNRLLKQGKPVDRSSTKVEWTVLAGIVQETRKRIIDRTGVKCLGAGEVDSNGDLVHDSHAEVVARRGLLRYLYTEIEKCLYNEKNAAESIFKRSDQQDGEDVDEGSVPFVLKSRDEMDVRFHLYVSQAPCGDASTESLAQHLGDGDGQGGGVEGEVRAKKRPRIDDKDTRRDSVNKGKFGETSETVAVGLLRGRQGFASLGSLRTKPGRLDADTTYSMSCSDKIAKWNVVGMQSALLSTLIPPIYLTSVVVGDLYNYEGLRRALYGRVEGIEGLPHGFTVNKPYLLRSTIEFDRSVTSVARANPQARLITSDAAICWYEGVHRHDVVVQGRRQGFSSKVATDP